MQIKNGKVFLDRSFVETTITFAQTITAIGAPPVPDALDASGCFIIPGLVDIHTHEIGRASCRERVLLIV